MKKANRNGDRPSGGEPQVHIGKLSEFRPQAVNLNQHTERGLRMLDDSMSEDGYVAPMTAAADGEVIDGSARLERAFDKFDDEAIIISHDGTRPIIARRLDIPDANNPIAKRISLRANRIAEADLSWDAGLLAELAASEPKMVEGMFSDKELAEILSQTGTESKDAEPQVDKAEELRQKWGTETGQLWVIGNHRLLVGDATNKADVGRLMGDNRASAVVTDPPYGQAFLSNYYGPNQSAPNPMGRLENDETPKPEMLSLWLDVLALKGALYVCTRWAQCEAWRAWIAERLKVRNIIIWKKNNWSAGDLEGAFGFMYEQIVFASRDGHKIRGARLPDVWEFDREAPDLHPTVKPVELMARAVQSSTDRGDVVADPFVGSGPTVVACENLGRKCYAMDVEAKFAATTLERMTTAFPHLKIERSDRAEAA